MLDRSFGVLSAVIAMAVLPLALSPVHAPHPQVAVSIAAQPVAIDVHIAMHKLDLAQLSAADFGDNDTVR